MNSTKSAYKATVTPELMKRFAYTNIMQVPKLEKIVLNCGVGTQKERDVLGEAVNTLTTITGQKAVITKAKKALAGFKIREGNNIGCKVTLRGPVMYDFLTRLIHSALPRVRDFRGIKNSGFDGFGNYTMGIIDQAIFPEIELDKVKHTIGMNVSFVTSANSDDEGKALLELLGLPFAK